jgi:hypothetical protein
MRRMSIITVVAALLVLSACGSGSPLGDLGGIFGSPSTSQPSDVSGTVTYVDTAQQRIDLSAQYVNGLKDSRTGSIYYDSRTRVEFNGGTYAVTDLERGDEISVRGANDNGRYVASVITVTRNVRG